MEGRLSIWYVGREDQIGVAATEAQEREISRAVARGARLVALSGHG